MRRIVIAAVVAVVMALVARPALAQIPGLNVLDSKMPPTAEEIARSKEIDQAYKETLSKLPATKTPADPWSNARDTDASQKAKTKPRPTPN